MSKEMSSSLMMANISILGICVLFLFHFGMMLLLLITAIDKLTKLNSLNPVFSHVSHARRCIDTFCEIQNKYGCLFFIFFSVFQFTMISFAFHSLLFFKLNPLKCVCMVLNFLGGLGWVVGLILTLDDYHKSFMVLAKMVRKELHNIEDENDKEAAREVLEVTLTFVPFLRISCCVFLVR